LRQLFTSKISVAPAVLVMLPAAGAYDALFDRADEWADLPMVTRNERVAAAESRA
jgi:hypothetical protein